MTKGLSMSDRRYQAIQAARARAELRLGDDKDDKDWASFEDAVGAAIDEYEPLAGALESLTQAIEELALEWTYRGEFSGGDEFQREAYDALMQARAVLGRTTPIGSTS